MLNGCQTHQICNQCITEMHKICAGCIYYHKHALKLWPVHHGKSSLKKGICAKVAYIAGNSSRSAKQSNHVTSRDQHSVCVFVCMWVYFEIVAFDVTRP